MRTTAAKKTPVRRQPARRRTAKVVTLSVRKTTNPAFAIDDVGIILAIWARESGALVCRKVKFPGHPAPSIDIRFFYTRHDGLLAPTKSGVHFTTPSEMLGLSNVLLKASRGAL